VICRPGRVAAVIAAVVLGGLGCSQPSPPCGLGLCDIRDVDCQRRIAESTGCLREAPAPNVPVTFQSRATRDQQAMLPASPEQEQAFATWSRALALLALADPDATLADYRTELASKVGGQYSPTDKSITVFTGQGDDLSSFGYVALLVHEYVHAIQDAAVDLTIFSAVHEYDRDHSLGANALIEGDATVVGDRAKAWLWGRDPESIDWSGVFETWRRNSRREALGSRAPVRLAGSFFHYPFGAPFVDAVRATNGWSAVDALYAQPPSGARQVIQGAAAAEPAGGPWEEDLGDDAVPVLPPRFQFVGADRLGAWALDQCLLRLVPPPTPDGTLATAVSSAVVLPDADPTVARLRGDVFSVFTDSDTGATVITWRLRMATPLDAGALRTTLGLSQGPDAPYADSFVFVDDRDVVFFATSLPDELPNLGDLTFMRIPPPSMPIVVTPELVGVP